MRKEFKTVDELNAYAEALDLVNIPYKVVYHSPIRIEIDDEVLGDKLENKLWDVAIIFPDIYAPTPLGAAEEVKSLLGFEEYSTWTYSVAESGVHDTVWEEEIVV